MRRAVLALLALAAPVSEAEPAASQVIQSPEKQSNAVSSYLSEWLTAFNTNDPAIIKAFYSKRLGDDGPVFALENAADTCGFDVARVESRSPTAMTVLLSQRCLPGLQRAKLEVAPDGKLKTLEFRPLPLLGDGAVTATAAIAGRLAARNAFAGSIIIVTDGKRTLANSWGLADATAQTPINLDTPMFLASAGKMFTAVSVLQLVEAGKIDLDAPMGKYLTNYPNAEMAKVTIRQLLTHRGGTGDIGTLGREDGVNRARFKTIDDIVELNGHRPPDFTPGLKDDYSNYGFILLGAVIERVTRTSYYDYVEEHVFKPAGMLHTGFPDHYHLKGVGVGYTNFFGAEPKLVTNTSVLPWRGASAGGGVSTANDMLRFFDALKTGKLLSPAMFKLATTPGATSWYGMGFVVKSGAGESYGHGGNSYGMDVALHHYVKNDTTFICLATRDMVCNRLIFAWYLRTFKPDK